MEKTNKPEDKKQIILIFLIITMIIGVELLAMFSNYNDIWQDTSVENGYINIKDTSFSQEGSVYLNGNWKTYRHQLIMQNSNYVEADDVYTNIPIRFLDDCIYENNNYNSSYSIEIDGLNTDTYYYITLFSMYGNYKIYVDGKVVCSNQLGEGYVIENFCPNTKKITVVIESNSDYLGGIGISPKLFAKEQYESSSHMRIVISAFSIGAMSIYLVSFYILHVLGKTKKENIYIYLFIVIGSIRFLVSTLPNILGHSMVSSYLTGEYMSLLKASISLVCSLYGLWLSNKLFATPNGGKRTNKVLYTTIILTLCIMSFYGVVYYKYILLIEMIMCLVVTVYAYTECIKAIILHHQGALEFTIGYVGLNFGILTDSLRYNGLISYNIDYVLPICFFIFLISIDLRTHQSEKKEYAEHIEADLLKTENTNQAIMLMIGQIKPHFIYNSLLSIKYLCRHDPEQAEKAIVDFSNYLRGNMDSISNNYPIPVSKELEHVKNYVMLEKMRFQDRLEVEYEIDSKDFYIPTLTIQPIVENAIRHGVTKKEDGGRVVVKTFGDSEFWYVTVEDNGVGFDVNRKMEDGTSHIGIKNIQNRIGLIVNGQVEVVSEVGKGTKVIVKIPVDSSWEDKTKGKGEENES